MQMQALSTADQRLVHALQIEPRASWNQLASVLRVDAGTLARRWERLSAEGLAWISGVPTDLQLALVEVHCDLSHLGEVVAKLQAEPNVLVIDFTTGSRELIALVVVRDLAELSELSVDRLATVTGVRSAQSHIANELLIDGGSWRLRSLDAGEVALIPRPRPPRSRAARQVPDDLREAICREVWIDGRVPIATIAERSGFSPQRVSDGLATLRHQGLLRFRTDIARAATEWPIYAWYFIEAPASVIERARRTITSVPEVRIAFTSASRFNLILAVWLRRLSDIDRFELALERALAGARIADRAVVFRSARHMNRLIGTDSLAIAPGDSPVPGPV